MSCHVFIAISVDGFIARPDGSLDWLDAFNATVQPPDEDCGYKAFMKTIDFVVMGRRSYEKVCSFDCDWPYHKPVVVLTTNRTSVLTAEHQGPAGTKLGISQCAPKETPGALVARLREQNGRKMQHLRRRWRDDSSILAGKTLAEIDRDADPGAHRGRNPALRSGGE